MWKLLAIIGGVLLLLTWGGAALVWHLISRKSTDINPFGQIPQNFGPKSLSEQVNPHRGYLCVKCRIRPRRAPNQRYCRECHSAYMKEYRAKNVSRGTHEHSHAAR